MLQRTTHPNGVVTYQSPLLHAAGITHAFSTRIGGISTYPYDSLNLGNPPDAPPDSAANIQENFRRLQSALNAADRPRAWVKQVHGSRVELLAPEPDSEYAETLDAEIRARFTGQTSADGIVTTVPGVLLTIRVADCVPVLLASQNGIVAALHAGWRGVISGIVENGIQTLRNGVQIRCQYASKESQCARGWEEIGGSAEQKNGLGMPQIPPQVRALSSANVPSFAANSAQLEPPFSGNRQVIAAIGPGISVANFEIGEEVAAAFEERGLGSAVVRQGGGQRPHVDLPQAIRKILERNGVNHIDGNDLCTFRNAAEFYSHRRENGQTGRMVALIAARYNRPHEAFEVPGTG